MLTILFATCAHAAVSLTPGQTVMIPASSVPTAVSCVASGATTKTATSTTTPTSRGSTSPSSGGGGSSRQANAGSATFCYCRARAVDAQNQFYLVKAVVPASGERVETEIKMYDTQKQCDRAVGQHPACR